MPRKREGQKLLDELAVFNPPTNRLLPPKGSTRLQPQLMRQRTRSADQDAQPQQGQFRDLFVPASPSLLNGLDMSGLNQADQEELTEALQNWQPGSWGWDIDLAAALANVPLSTLKKDEREFAEEMLADPKTMLYLQWLRENDPTYPQAVLKVRITLAQGL